MKDESLQSRMSSLDRLDCLNADLLLAVIKFLPFKDACRFSMQSKRLYFMVHQFRERCCRPQITCAAGSTEGEEEQMDVFERALEKIQSPPQLALFLSAETSSRNSVDIARIPSTAQVLGCTAARPTRRIQTISCNDDDEDGESGCDYKSRNAVMLIAGLRPETTKIQPFQWHFPDQGLGEHLEPFLQQFAPELDWRTFILFAEQMGEANVVTTALQQRFPEALVVGGFCDSSFVFLPSSLALLGDLPIKELRDRYTASTGQSAKRLTKTEILSRLGTILHELPKERSRGPRSVCGVAFAGDIPCHAVVSQGLGSLAQERDLVIHESRRVPNEQFEHVVTRVEDRSLRTFSTPEGCLGRYPEATHVGVKRLEEDGYEVYDVDDVYGEGVIDEEGENVASMFVFPSYNPDPLTGCRLDFFNVTPTSVRADVDNCMRLLKVKLDGEEVLGAIMISCIGRAPTDHSLFEEEMGDAKSFARSFPGVPCIGFYAGGEIGPRARARQESPFEATANACSQAYTAVFGVFSMPKTHDEMEFTELEDTPDVIQHFVRGRTKPH